MALEPFAGGQYDFSKLEIDEGVIVEFKNRSGNKQFFIRREDGSERLVWTPFDLDSRVGHRIRFVEHCDVGWLAYRNFEMKVYHVSKPQIERTFGSVELPPYGRKYRYLFILFWYLAVMLFGQREDGNGPFFNIWALPDFISVPIALSGVTLGIYLQIRFIHSLWKKPKVKDAFTNALAEEIKDGLYQ